MLILDAQEEEEPSRCATVSVCFVLFLRTTAERHKHASLVHSCLCSAALDLAHATRRTRPGARVPALASRARDPEHATRRSSTRRTRPGARYRRRTFVRRDAEQPGRLLSCARTRSNRAGSAARLPRSRAFAPRPGIQAVAGTFPAKQGRGRLLSANTGGRGRYKCRHACACFAVDIGLWISGISKPAARKQNPEPKNQGS